MKTWAGLAICGLLILSPLPVAADAESACRPSFRVLVGLKATDPVSQSTLETSVGLIGCADALRRLSDDDVRRVRKELTKVIERVDLGLGARKEREDFRLETAKRVNSAVGREVISDVLFFGTVYSER